MPTSPTCAVAQVVHCKTRLAHGSKGAEISLCSSHQAALGRKVSFLKCSQGLHERVGLYPTTWFLLIYTEDSIFPPVFSLPPSPLGTSLFIMSPLPSRKPAAPLGSAVV